jgi:hypothetical protein
VNTASICINFDSPSTRKRDVVAFSRNFHDEDASCNVVITKPTHCEFETTYFRRYYGFEEKTSSQGFKIDRVILIGKKRRISIRSSLCILDLDLKKVFIENRKRNEIFIA